MSDMEEMPHAIGTDERTQQIARLNDQLRCHQKGGQMVITRGVLGLASGAHVQSVVAAVAAFTDFTSDNDPHGEHDFGAFEFAGAKLFWKIDYYDADMRFGSPDPADPDVTTRLLTIMLREEY